jgi:hypothetical protein
MQRLKPVITERLSSPYTMADFHFWMTILWIALVIPTVFWLRSSVFWVSLMSIYAIIVTHWTGFSAAKGEQEIHAVVEEIDATN